MRDLFIVGAKLMGIYIFFIHAISNIAYLIQLSQQEGSAGGHYISVWNFLIVFAIQVGVSYFLVFKTEAIANTITLPPALPPNDSSSGLTITTALQTGIILLGVYVLITTMPQLLHQMTNEFIQSIINFRVDLIRSIVSVVKVALSLIMIFASEGVTRFILDNQYSRHYQ